jgi:hypothetical protein
VKLEYSYQGATLEFHYDGMTGTYLGHLEGLPGGSVSIQAASHDDLVEAFHQAVDTHASNLAIMERFAARQRKDASPGLAAIAPQGSEPDPFRHRQFLR